MHSGLWVLKSALVVLVGRLYGTLVWNRGKVEISSLHVCLCCLQVLCSVLWYGMLNHGPRVAGQVIWLRVAELEMGTSDILLQVGHLLLFLL